MRWLFLMCFVATSAGALTWERIYGNVYCDAGQNVRQTSDSGYVVCGYTYKGDTSYVYLIKLNAIGDTEWTRKYGKSGWLFNYGFSVRQTSDGGYIICGSCVIKVDANGDTEWTRPYGGYDVEQTFDGGYIICGYNVFLVKLDAKGDTEWTRAYGDGDALPDYGTSIRQTSDSGYIVCGTYDFKWDSCGDVFLLKINANGDTEWTRTYGGSGTDCGNCVHQTSDGGYIICGYTGSYGAGGDIYLLKVNANGDTEWTRTYGGSDYDYGYSVWQTSDGGYIICGCTESYGAGCKDIYLIKVNANGDTEWTRTYGGSKNDYGFSVQQTSDGGYIICGSTYSYGAGEDDVYLLKVNINGGFCNINIIEPNGDENWLAGSVHSIKIKNRRYYVNMSHLKMLFTPDGQNYSILADSIPYRDTLECDVILPNVNSSQCRIKVEAYDTAGKLVAVRISNPFTVRTMEITENAQKSKMRITYDENWIRIGCQNNLTLMLYDVNGRRIKKVNARKMWIGDVPEGIYFLRIKNAKEEKFVKIVKLK